MMRLFLWICFLVLAPRLWAQPFSGAGSLRDSTEVVDLLREAKGETADQAADMLTQALNISLDKSFFSLANESFTRLIELYRTSDNVALELESRLDYKRFLQERRLTAQEAANEAGIADLYFNHGIYSKAEEELQEAMHLAAVHRPDLLPSLRSRLAVTEHRLKKFDAARQHYQECIRWARGQQRWTEVLWASQQLSEMAIERKDSASVFDLNQGIYRLADSLGRDQDRSIALNNLGFAAQFAGRQQQAADFFQSALTRARSESNGLLEAHILQNLGLLAQRRHDLKSATDFLQEAAARYEANGRFAEEAMVHDCLALIYYQRNDTYRALVANDRCIKLGHAHKLAEPLAAGYQTRAVIYQSMYEYEDAYQSYKQYLEYRDSLGGLSRKSADAIVNAQLNLEQVERKRKSEYFVADKRKLENERLMAEREASEQRANALEKASLLKDAQLANQELNARRAADALALLRQQREVEMKKAEIEILNQNEKIKQLEIDRQKKEKEEARKKNQILEQDGKIKQLEIQRQAQRNRNLFFLVGGLGLLLLVIGFVTVQLRSKNSRIRRQNVVILENQKVIESEKEKSEKLLLNILPPTVAAELKENGASRPRHYPEVTVFFSDFAGFTHIAEKLSPEELVQTLDRIFLEFDVIAERYQMMRIKTIGDAYLAVAGMPGPDGDHAVHAAGAALDIRDFMRRFSDEMEAAGKPRWDVRIGLHVGPVVAGVVGIKKFAYDIWGDTVNTAARMESSGAPGQVNVSGDFYALIRDRFRCTHRGALPAKNKGEMDMYFIEGRK